VNNNASPSIHFLDRKNSPVEKNWNLQKILLNLRPLL
jgi:hypothetical protein